jgi:hypothetical protein
MADKKFTPEDQQINKLMGRAGGIQLSPQQQVPKVAMPSMKDRGKHWKHVQSGVIDTIKKRAEQLARFGSRNVPVARARFGSRNIPVQPQPQTMPVLPASSGPAVPKDTSYLNAVKPNEQIGAGLGLASPLAVMVPKKYQDTVASSARNIPVSQAPQATPARPTGPMSTIIAPRNMSLQERGFAKGLGLQDKYNTPGATTEERADVLSQIWERGGRPVIGRFRKNADGTMPSDAPVQDFRGAGGVLTPRGIDTGIVAGSKEAEEHQARMDRDGSGDIYGGGDRAAALASNRSGIFNRTTVDQERMARQRPQEKAGIGLTFEQSLATRKQEADERAAARTDETTRDKQEADERAAARTDETTRDKQEADERAAARTDETTRDKQEQELAVKREELDANKAINAAKSEAKGIKFDGKAWVDRDGKPLADDDQKVWTGRRLIVESTQTPEAQQAIAAWKADKKNNTVRIDRTTGKVVVLPTKDGWGDPAWMAETAQDGKTLRYGLPFEVDPIVASVLRDSYGI